MTRRDQIILMVIVAIAIVGGYYLLLLSPQTKKANDLNTQLTAIQARRAQDLGLVSAAVAAQAAYPTNIRAMRVLTDAIPPVDSTSRLLRQIDAAAAAAKVDFSGISLSSATSAAPAAPAAAPAAPAATGATGPAGPATTGAASAGAAKGPPPIPPGYSNTTPAPTVFYTTTFTGDYLQLSKFVDAMERFVAATKRRIKVRGRLIDVSSISVSQDPTKGTNTVSVTLAAYLLPVADQAPIAVTPGGVH